MTPRTIVVGNQSNADAPTLTAALAGAAPGDTIVLAAGVYEETVHISVDVTVTSAAPAEAEGESSDEGRSNGDNIAASGGSNSGDVVRAAVRGPVVVSASATLENIEVYGVVNVRRGRATLNGCDVHHGSDGVRVYPGASIEVRGCRIHHCAGGGDGVYFMSGASGTLSDTDVYECRVHGVHVRGSSVVLQGNRIRGCAFGISFEKAASGSCEDNIIEHASRFGILVTDASNPAVVGNTVRECGVLCLFVSNGGKGFCSRNNFDGSVHILANCPIQISGNQISGTADVDAAAM